MDPGIKEICDIAGHGRDLFVASSSSSSPSSSSSAHDASLRKPPPPPPPQKRREPMEMHEIRSRLGTDLFEDLSAGFNRLASLSKGKEPFRYSKTHMCYYDAKGRRSTAAAT